MRKLVDALKYQIAVSVIATILVSFTAAPAHADELAEQLAIRNETIDAARHSDFARLEAYAVDYRNTQGRTSGGLWKLTAFYKGLGAVFDDNHKDSDFWISKKAFASEWVRRFPASPTARMAYAIMLMGHAWSFRGEGYADTVQPQDWAPFYKYVEQARSYLESTKNVASKDPEWYVYMEEVAKVQGWTETSFEKLLDEGLTRYPKYYEIYFSAIEYYEPKWGGNDARVEQFAEEALRRSQALEGFGIYARIYWYASQSQYDTDLFSDSRVNWKIMKKGINDVLDKYPDSWNINNFAKFSCLAQDKVMTARLIKLVEGTPLAAAWGDVSLYQRCKDWSLSAR